MTPRINDRAPANVPASRVSSGLRITVMGCVGMARWGMTEQQILDDSGTGGLIDFRAVYEFAARVGRRVAL